MEQVREVSAAGQFDDTERASTAPAVSWRRGFDVADVAAGHPHPRPAAVSGLLDALEDSHVAVTGGVAAGKSTLCLLAARRWSRSDRGPVFHARDPPRDPAALRTRLSANADGDGRPLLVVENALADGGAAAALLVDELANDGVAVLVELQRADVDVATDAGADGAGRLGEHVGDALALWEAPPVDADEFAAAVDHYEDRTGTVVSSSVPTLYDALRNETSEGNVLLHFAHWVGSPVAAESALDRAVAAAYETVDGANDELVFDAAVVAAVLAAADLPAYPGFFYGLDADECAVDEALSSLVDVVLFYPSSGPRFESHHPLWATRFLETLADRDPDAPGRFARAVHAVLELLDVEARESVWLWFDEHSVHADRFDRPDRSGEATAAADRGLLTSDARRRRVAVGTTGQVVDRLFDLGSRHPALAPLYGTCDDDVLDLEAYCSPTTRARAVLERGRMYLDAGEYDRADAEFRDARGVLEETAEVPRKVADRLGVECDVARGRAAQRRSEFDRARRYHRAAYDAACELGGRTSRARSHLHLGVTDIKRGDLRGATAHLEAARRLLRDRDRHHLLAGVLQRLGVVHLRRGRLDDAERVLRDGLDRFERGGDRVGAAKCRSHLGLVSTERDDHDVAADRFRRAMRTCRDVGYRPGELKAHLNLGNVAVHRDDLERAVERYESARSLARSLDDGEEEATALNNLGVVAVERGRLDEASDHYRRSLRRHRAVGDRQGEGRALSNLGEVDRERGRHDRAVERLRESVRIRRETGNRIGRARSRHELGRCLAARGDDEAARGHLRAALETFESYDADRKAAAVRDALDGLDEPR